MRKLGTCVLDTCEAVSLGRTFVYAGRWTRGAGRGTWDAGRGTLDGTGHGTLGGTGHGTLDPSWAGTSGFLFFPALLFYFFEFELVRLTLGF